MIALDSSALVSIALSEPGSSALVELIERSSCVVGAPTLVECHLVLQNKGVPLALTIFTSIVGRPNVVIMPFEAAHYRLACDAFDRFGKGRGHPAQLNFGDCLTYAVAKYHDVPLLYKGDDFRHTDLRAALS